MTYCVSLSLKNKKILIVGGGMASYRKAVRWKKEQADITVIAIHFCEAYIANDMKLIQKEYHSCDLNGYFLVLAATDDPILNHQIVQDANQYNLLSMSMHQDEEVVCHAMRSIQTKETVLAVSTMGSFPLLGNEILQQMEVMVKEQYDERLVYLKKLRQWCFQHCRSKQKISSFLQQLSIMEIHDLKFLNEITAGKAAVLYTAHGTANVEQLHSIVYPFIDRVRHQLQLAAGIVYLGDKVISKLAYKGIHMSSLDEMLQLLEVIQPVECIVIPALLQHGAYMNQIEQIVKACSFPIKIGQPLFHEESQIIYILNTLISNYWEDEKQLLFLYHPTEGNMHDIKQYEQDDITICSLNEEIVLKCQKPVKLIPLFMLLGFHGKKDIFTKEASVQKQLENQGYIVLPCMTSLWEYDFIQQLLIESVN